MSDDAGPGAAGPGEGRLPCGVDSVDLLAQVCDGDGERLTPHQQDCEHCRRVLADDQQLWAPLRTLADESVRAPRSIMDRALAYVRELTGDPRAPLVPFEEEPPAPSTVAGAAWVTARVVVRCVRLAAEDVDGVRLALSHLDLSHLDGARPDGARPDGARPDLSAPEPGAGSSAAPDTAGSVVVELTVAADYGRDLRALAARIRTRVAAEVRTLTGSRPVSVSVHVDDVFPARRPREAGSEGDAGHSEGA